MTLKRLALLLSVSATVAACGNSPTAAVLDAGEFQAAKGATELNITDATTTSTTGTADAPKDGEARGGGFVGSGS